MPVRGYRRCYPKSGDRVDGKGGRRIVLARVRPRPWLNKKTNTTGSTKAKVVWRHPDERHSRQSLLENWVKWAKKKVDTEKVEA